MQRLCRKRATSATWNVFNNLTHRCCTCCTCDPFSQSRPVCACALQKFPKMPHIRNIRNTSATPTRSSPIRDWHSCDCIMAITYRFADNSQHPQHIGVMHSATIRNTRNARRAQPDPTSQQHLAHRQRSRPGRWCVAALAQSPMAGVGGGASGGRGCRSETLAVCPHIPMPHTRATIVHGQDDEPWICAAGLSG